MRHPAPQPTAPAEARPATRPAAYRRATSAVITASKRSASVSKTSRRRIARKTFFLQERRLDPGLLQRLPSPQFRRFPGRGGDRGAQQGAPDAAPPPAFRHAHQHGESTRHRCCRDDARIRPSSFATTNSSGAGPAAENASGSRARASRGFAVPGGARTWPTAAGHGSRPPPDEIPAVDESPPGRVAQGTASPIARRCPTSRRNPCTSLQNGGSG